MRPNATPDEFVKWLKSQPPEFLEKGNEITRLETEKDYEEFVRLFKEGLCSICGNPLKTFSANKPCLHWLLRPKKFKKKHLPTLFQEFTYFRISAYVRWVASIDKPMQNINDIEEEHPGGKLIDFTAKHKHLTWSFSCSKSDFEGHMTTKSGNYPHYHMQMKLDGQSFIRYSDYHIPFHKDDLFDIELHSKHEDFAVHSYGPGTGMQELMGSEEGLEFIVDHSTPTDNRDDAAYDLSTMIMAPEGGTISGDLIADAVKEAKKITKNTSFCYPGKIKRFRGKYYHYCFTR